MGGVTPLAYSLLFPTQRCVRRATFSADHFHTQFLCLAHFPCLDFKRRHALIDLRQTIARPAPLRDSFDCGSFLMQDMLWIGLILLLLVASLGYAALCERA